MKLTKKQTEQFEQELKQWEKEFQIGTILEIDIEKMAKGEQQ